MPDRGQLRGTGRDRISGARRLVDVEPPDRAALVVEDQQPRRAGRRGQPTSLVDARANRHHAVLAQRERVAAEEGQPADAPVVPEEPLDEGVGRRGQQLLGSGDLDELARHSEDRDAVTELDRLVDVVRDEDDGLAEFLLKPEELLLQLGPHHRVDRAERLVHEHHRRVCGQGTGDSDALLLAPDSW